MNINKKFVKYNYSKGRDKIKYIVIHDTGNKGKGANARAHFNYFNGGNRDASADFFVDDKEAFQVVDYTKNYSWHCGDGNGKYGITNRNSIGIEICINSDGDYKKAVDNTVELVKKLMKELDISIDNVVRHYDASRKKCPNSMSKSNWKAWKEFKRRLKTVTKYYLKSAELDKLLGKKADIKLPFIHDIKGNLYYDKYGKFRTGYLSKSECDRLIKKYPEMEFYRKSKEV